MAYTSPLHHTAGTSLSETIGSWADAKAALGELKEAVKQRFTSNQSRTVITPPAVDRNAIGDQPNLPDRLCNNWSSRGYYEQTM